MCYGFDGEGALRRSLEERGLSRRSMVKGALGAVAGGAMLAAVPGLLSPAGAAVAAKRGACRVPPGRISIQLWTLRDDLNGAAGFDATMTKIAEMGYPRVEQALGYFGKTAAELRAFYDGLGIRASSSHDGISATPADLQTKLQNAATLGQRYMVVPYLASSSLSDWQTWAEQMNVEAAAAKRYGIAYGYHNHAHEFTTDLGGGVTPWDVLTTELDPGLVHLEIDIYWAVTGGVNRGLSNDEAIDFAIDTITSGPQRVRQYHVKDRNPTTGDHVDLGTGFIDFAKVFEAHEVEEYIVENDTPEISPLRTAEVGYSYLRRLRY
ncbi:sugar phosphate isomerase/epimerase family protein [Nocardioides luteus]|uniref:sugar phosphate isomerase/epimerase family protein n=1 Tax=Nocardioides luteus TaxID=1844 RepID=UPI0018CB4790|nr:sugar phosphate isomerase/epimerase [Nocardioides luteus]MBG6097534.1 sugar phosphate isomerase/epimerase [Nocardioides luteus]